MWDGLVTAGLEAFNAGVQSALTIAGWTVIAGALLIALLAPNHVAEVESLERARTRFAG